MAELEEQEYKVSQQAKVDNNSAITTMISIQKKTQKKSPYLPVFNQCDIKNIHFISTKTNHKIKSEKQQKCTVKVLSDYQGYSLVCC